MLSHRPDHFLAPLAADQASFALLVSHLEALSQSLDQSEKGVKATPASEAV